jgi:hypothetical protein
VLKLENVVKVTLMPREVARHIAHIKTRITVTGVGKDYAFSG